METGSCSTRPIVSVTVGAEHTMKHLHETTEGFPVTKPLMLLDIGTKSAVFILKQKIFVPNNGRRSLRIQRIPQYMRSRFTTVIPATP